MRSRQIRVRRQSTRDGAWELAEAPASPPLAALVRGYVGFVETSVVPLRRSEAPSGSPVLIMNFGAPLEVGAPGRPTVAYSGSFVARLSDLPAQTEFTGTSAGVEVRFTPLGLHLFCGLAVDELPDPAIGLSDLLGSDGRRLTEALAGAPGWAARFDLLDAVIERRFAIARPPTPSVEWAWRALESSAGLIEVGRLSERIGCSRRHLIAGFREQVGVPPKVAARILRFERAARLVRDAPRQSLARIAGECGFHDQSHMTREFRALAGATPGGYRAAALPDYLGVAVGPSASGEVNFVQATAA